MVIYYTHGKNAKTSIFYPNSEVKAEAKEEFRSSVAQLAAKHHCKAESIKYAYSMPF